MVLILTAAGTPAERVTGRGLGGGDYLPKPLHIPELILRIRSRRQPAAPGPDPERGRDRLDPLHRTLTHDGQQIQASQKDSLCSKR